MTGTGIALDSAYRASSLSRAAAAEFDIVVIGGGITGLGAALDAATRGLSVALLEAQDFAAGTSSRSGKLIHGGLRYLEMLDFSLVREALRERRLLLTTLAPHLVKPVPLLFPLTHRIWERCYVGAGLVVYDALGSPKVVPRARHLSRRQALKVAPGLRPSALIGAVQFYDAEEDDARLALYVARTAADHGAALLNYASGTGLMFADGRVAGVRAHDHHAERDFEVRAKHVVAAAGVWNDDIQAWTPARPLARVRPSKGVHIILPRHCINSATGLFVRTEKSILFVVPWGKDHWLVGDTDTDWPYDKREPAPTSVDIEYLLAKVNSVLAEPVSRSDVVGVFAGLRPLVDMGRGVKTQKLSREHKIYSPAPGLSMIAGGKYTTYRVMAKELIDVAAAHLDAPAVASCTERVPILGAVGYEQRWNQRAKLAARAGLPVWQIERLLDRYGDCIDQLLAIIEKRPELKASVPGLEKHLAIEVAYACSHEGALHLEDVLARRTRVAIETRDRGLSAAIPVAGIMAAELGCDQDWINKEVAQYTQRLEAEAAAEAQEDDAAANAARGVARGPGSWDPGTGGTVELGSSEGENRRARA
jgi:glycerol-3-phosphate dehydrogenase